MDLFSVVQLELSLFGLLVLGISAIWLPLGLLRTCHLKSLSRLMLLTLNDPASME